MTFWAAVLLFLLPELLLALLMIIVMLVLVLVIIIDCRSCSLSGKVS